MSGFEKPITIKQAIDNIVERNYLLPAIQRKFVWDSERIEMLFDSIMRGYPINSFMFWKVTDPEVKNNYRFYEFLTYFRERYHEDNPDFDTKGHKDFMAVIDGQQRLTSLYLGLKGSFAYKLPRKWMADDELSMPTRHLYLNLGAPVSDEDERKMQYEFSFLTLAEVEDREGAGGIWYKVNDILALATDDDLDELIDREGWSGHDFTKRSIRTLWRCIHQNELINYYLETTQEQDTVLDIFIRTNSGGTPLSFSNLLMSTITAQWSRLDARKEVSSLIKQVQQIGSPAFNISSDLVLKACLVIFNKNIRFRVKNFDRASIALYEDNWERVSRAALACFKVLRSFGFNDQSLRAKNAAIPLIYFIFKKKIEEDFDNPLRYKEDKEAMRKWLALALVKGVFGSQGDVVLTGIRNAIDAEFNACGDNVSTAKFPLGRIQKEFKGNAAKNLALEDDTIAELLSTRKEDPQAFVLLSLLYPHVNFDQELHMDHLHPEASFKDLTDSGIPTDELDFASDPAHWNSLLNLQLLNGILNGSKNAKSLKGWVSAEQVNLVEHLIPNDCSLELSEFKQFIQKRKELLTLRLKEFQ